MNKQLTGQQRIDAQISAYKESIEKMDNASAIDHAWRLGFDVDRLSHVVGMQHPSGSRRLDAGESALLARALIYMKAKSVDVQYAPTKWREIFENNTNTEVPLGADKVSTPQFDQLGAFTQIANGANDLTNIDVSQGETLNKFIPYGAKISYTVFDLARAAFSGIPLDTKKQQAARMSWERQLDGIAAIGDSAAGIYGISNHPNIQSISTNNAGTWATKAAAGNMLQIVDDVNKLCKSVISTTDGNVEPDTLIMGVAHHALIATTPLSLANASNVTVLDFILRSNPWIKRVIPWQRLETAGGSGLPRVIAFSTRTDVCEFMINDLSLLAPEVRGMNLEIAMYGRSAGVVASQPKGIAYMDAV